MTVIDSTLFLFNLALIELMQQQQLFLHLPWLLLLHFSLVGMAI